MLAFCCQRMLSVFVCLQLALPLCAAIAQEEGRPSVHIKSDEQRKADERRQEEEKRPDREPVTAIDEVGRKFDLTRSHDQEFFDAARLDAEIKTQETLARIAREEVDPHRRDGSEFRNDEGRLPQHEKGYYTEYVYRPEGVESPGSERIVIGKNGEIYYTPDHYKTFLKMK
jgi:guanyl-specific ribonuclease Sa